MAVGKSRLLDSSAKLLDEHQTLNEAELQAATLLTLHLGRVQVRGTTGFSMLAFSAILGDGSVVTGGEGRYGGDSRAAQDRLKGVQQIQASEKAFAAILSDVCVVTWGDPDYGGNSRAVQDQLKGVQEIQAKLPKVRLQLSCLTDALLLGATRSLVVTLALCKIS